jgi:N-acetylmuramoyl-L-alanine amidase
MKVDNDLLCDDDGNPCRFDAVPSYDKNIKIKPKYIILHYTAGIPIEGTIETFRTQQVSSHLVVDRDGSIIQCVPFNLRAWHAGPSHWADRTDLNSHSIGIEINNFGLVRRNAENQWGRGNTILPDEDVIEATHKFLYKTIRLADLSGSPVGGSPGDPQNPHRRL